MSPTPSERLAMTVRDAVEREYRGGDGVYRLDGCQADNRTMTTLDYVRHANEWARSAGAPDADIPSLIDKVRAQFAAEPADDAAERNREAAEPADNIVPLPHAVTASQGSADAPRKGKPPAWAVKYEDLVAWLDRDDCPVKPLDRLILHTLVDFFNVKEKASRPGMATLARRTGLNTTTIWRRTRAMADEGWIAIDSRGEGRSFSYRFTFPLIFPAA